MKSAEEQPFVVPASPEPCLDGLGLEPRLAILRSLKGSGKTIPLRTVGMSMQPLIQADSTAEITFMPVRAVRPGDIILFHANETMVLHRVISVKRDGDQVSLVEKGDHQPFSSTITGEQYLGVMTALKSGNRCVRRNTAAGRMQAWMLLVVARFEMILYAVKTRIKGRAPTKTGRFLNRVLHGLRGAVLRACPGRRKRDGGA